jgi:hypothetical protein
MGGIQIKDASGTSPTVNTGASGQASAGAHPLSAVGAASSIPAHNQLGLGGPPQSGCPIRVLVGDKRVIRLDIQFDINESKRKDYEAGIYRLFFREAPFTRTRTNKAGPLIFGETAVAKEKKARVLGQRAIDYANEVMRFMIVECGIDEKQLLKAATKYKDEEPRLNSLRKFLYEYMKIGSFGYKTDHPGSVEDHNIAAMFIENVQSNLEKVVQEISKEDPSLFYYVLAQHTTLSEYTDAMALTKDETRVAFKCWSFVRCIIAFATLNHYQAILSYSDDSSRLLLAAKAVAGLEKARKLLLPEDNPVPADLLLANLREAAIIAWKKDLLENLQCCIDGLASLLPVAPEQAFKSLMELTQLFKSEPTIVKRIKDHLVAFDAQKVFDYFDGKT